MVNKWFLSEISSSLLGQCCSSSPSYITTPKFSGSSRQTTVRTTHTMSLSHFQFLFARAKSSKIEHIMCNVLLLHFIGRRNIAYICRKKKKVLKIMSKTSKYMHRNNLDTSVLYFVMGTVYPWEDVIYIKNSGGNPWMEMLNTGIFNCIVEPTFYLQSVMHINEDVWRMLLSTC